MAARNDDDDALLLCDEELFISTPSPPTPRRIDDSVPSVVFSDVNQFDEEEIGSVLQNYLRKEVSYMPVDGYPARLRSSSSSSPSGLRAARFRAVRWILTARSRLCLQYGTVFAAVNYLDRFFSLCCHIQEWEVWMTELAAMACLSIASKLDEVSVFSFDDFQSEDMEHAYQPITIQQMELAVLKALDWRLLCVTPHSYIGLLVHRLGCPIAPLAARTTELLLRALLAPEFVGHSASSIAVAALRRSIEESIPLDSDAHIAVLEELVPAERMGEVEDCRRLMEEEKIADPRCCPTSPVTVIPVRRTKVLDRQVDIGNWFFCNSEQSGQVFCSKRQRKHGEFRSSHPSE